MARVKSWWRLKKVRHRDAVVLASLSSALLLAGQLPTEQQLYQQYLRPVASEPMLFFFNTLLLIVAYLSIFGGILVLIGGVNFLWGYVSRGRFLLSLGVGLSLISLLRQIALALLTTGSPLAAVTYFTGSLVGLGLITGFASYALMHEYALMLKKHARSMWRQWRRSKRPKPVRRRTRSTAGRS